MLPLPLFRRLFFKVLLLTWLLIVAITGIMFFLVYRTLEATLQRSLTAQAEIIEASISQVAIPAMANRSLSKLVDHCLGVMQVTPQICLITTSDLSGLTLQMEPGKWKKRSKPAVWEDQAQTTVGGHIQQNPIGTESIFLYTSELKFGSLPMGWIHIGLSLNSYLSYLDSIKRTAVGIALAGIVIGFLLSIILSRQLTRPLFELEIFSRRVAEGDLTAKVEIRTGDEVERLATSFNLMTVSLARSKQELIASQAFTKSVLQSMADGVAVVSIDGKIIEANQALGRLIGVDSLALSGQDFAESLFPDPERFRRDVWSRLQSQNMVEHLQVWVKGATSPLVPILLSASSVADSGGTIQAVVAIIKDISLLLQAEAQQRRLAVALEQSADAILITNNQGSIDYVNPAFERLYGFTMQEVRGQTPRLLKSGEHSPGFYANLWETIIGGNTWRGRLDNRVKSGAKVTVETSISPIRLPGGPTSGFVALQRDITRQLELEEHLNQSQKVEAIGTLAGGIAHDFNNILCVILASAEVAYDMADGKPELEQIIDGIKLATQRGADLVRQILLFSRRRLGTPEELVSLHTIVKETVKLLRSTIPLTIEIALDLSRENLTIRADPIQIQQLIMNLCTNSAYAMRAHGGRLTITTALIEADTRKTSLFPGTVPGTFVQIKVIDTGTGIPPELLGKVFDPFFTTKPAGEGTGLGLAVSASVVQRYHGGIRIESEVGSGTTVEILLPAITDGEVRDHPTAVQKMRGTGRLVFVDDETTLCRIFEQEFQRLGYDVSVFSNPNAVVTTLRQLTRPPDLLISDYAMPKKYGFDLLRELREHFPDLPVIFWTGNPQAIDPVELERWKVAKVLMKPLSIAALSREIAAQLNAQRTPIS
ncbi:MAG TPA: PAS domain S-box protein [Candidatus Ozemobacteraceae bacterium]|nr:PAS domain S-box protein [Candidatus Ozemobacteraceae bacterium]